MVLSLSLYYTLARMRIGKIANYQIGVIYGTTWHSDDSKSHLETALTTFLKSTEEGGEALYILYYEQEQTSKSSGDLSEASTDLAFNDEILEEVETQWKSVMEEVDLSSFMRFEDREGIIEYDDEDVEEF
jgi:hypothetical protein